MARGEDPNAASGESREIQRAKPDSDAELTVTSVLATHVSGPIPSPGILRDYEEVLTGSAERIISAWEEENRHRRELDSKILEQDAVSSEMHYGVLRRGQIFAFILAILLFSGSMFLVYQGNSTGGVAVLLGEIVALVGVFVIGRRAQTKRTGSPADYDSDSEPVE